MDCWEGKSDTSLIDAYHIYVMVLLAKKCATRVYTATQTQESFAKLVFLSDTKLWARLHSPRKLLYTPTLLQKEMRADLLTILIPHETRSRCLG